MQRCKDEDEDAVDESNLILQCEAYSEEISMDQAISVDGS
jgi:hypothetical protein